MKLYKLVRIQKLNLSIHEAWHFFSSPRNLKNITPPDMDFEILTPDLQERVYEGMIIEYSVKPLFDVRVKWVTEIKSVDPYKMFIDEQRFGPYKFWHHQHLFKKISDHQIEMTDLIHYAIGFGILGDLVHRWWVKNRLEQIFTYRYQIIDKLINSEDDT